jgi:hypothetical protein
MIEHNVIDFSVCNMCLAHLRSCLYLANSILYGFRGFGKIF